MKVHKEKSLREIEKVISISELGVTANLRYQESELDDAKQAEKIEKEVKDLASAIQAHYKARRLSEEYIWDIICDYFMGKVFADSQFMKKATYPDLKTLAHAIFKAQEEKLSK